MCCWRTLLCTCSYSRSHFLINISDSLEINLSYSSFRIIWLYVTLILRPDLSRCSAVNSAFIASHTSFACDMASKRLNWTRYDKMRGVGASFMDSSYLTMFFAPCPRSFSRNTPHKYISDGISEMVVLLPNSHILLIISLFNITNCGRQCDGKYELLYSVAFM